MLAQDIVRELVRSRIGGESIREKQRNVVEAFVSAHPKGGWEAQSSIGQYAAIALQYHMAEALLPDSFEDTQAQS